MTMHLVRGMTTINTKKRKAKKKSKRQVMSEQQHDKWLRKMGVHPDQIKEKNANTTNLSVLSVPDYSPSGNTLPTSDVIPGGSTAPAERQVYSGERTLLGVAVMHKSNLVPVFGKNDAKEISRMRRN